MINITLNHQSFKVRSNQTILNIAKKVGVKVPTLCHLPRKSTEGNSRAVCRICVVEVKGINGLVSACSTKATEGMNIFTHSESVLKSRRVLLEFMLAESSKKLSEDSIVKKFCSDLGVHRARFTVPQELKSNTRRKVFEYLSIDPSLCVHCDRCILACDSQDAIKRSGFGYNITNTFGSDEGGFEASNCSYCGDCAAVCPTGAIKNHSAV